MFLLFSCLPSSTNTPVTSFVPYSQVSLILTDTFPTQPFYWVTAIDASRELNSVFRYGIATTRSGFSVCDDHVTCNGHSTKKITSQPSGVPVSLVSAFHLVVNLKQVSGLHSAPGPFWSCCGAFNHTIFMSRWYFPSSHWIEDRNFFFISPLMCVSLGGNSENRCPSKEILCI